MPQIKVSDPTLRDGSHAISNQLTIEQISAYIKMADHAGLDYIEVGHGNGLGASSFQIGKSRLSDAEMLTTAKKYLKNTKLSVHVIPGFATIKKDILPAIDYGVEAFRIASHCTEADITKKHIEYLRNNDIEVFGVLMMSHMASTKTLLESCLKMEQYGAHGVILMDSAGTYFPKDVSDRIGFIKQSLQIELGFHAHNNLGLAVANTLAAVEAGATIVDGTSRGFGAGAGNCQLEILIPVLHKMGYKTKVDLYTILNVAELAEKELLPTLPFSKTMSILTGLSGVFSGFAKHIQSLATKNNVDPKDVVIELGNRRVVAGQEDMILEVITGLMENDI